MSKKSTFFKMSIILVFMWVYSVLYTDFNVSFSYEGKKDWIKWLNEHYKEQ
ncbi:hypothetical protein [Oceanirhabdus seepicola]|uniref:Uncharacterized protein n=1 Tax=Oceanirhabdus seepicola TaxID=2828781 RepID=A0A9J6P5C8_9CLOT|nr:hypothetical protein [Oceanirhabdus seepicola]MCM1991334.1 hypothetical protein [Oceanirhabdus seepicola]